MVYLNSTKILECIDIESITSETVTFNLDGERLRNELYQDLKIEHDNDGPIQILKFQDAPFIKICPNEAFDEDDCKQLAIEIKNRLNSQIQTKLNIK